MMQQRKLILQTENGIYFFFIALNRCLSQCGLLKSFSSLSDCLMINLSVCYSQDYWCLQYNEEDKRRWYKVVGTDINVREQAISFFLYTRSNII